MPTIIVAERPDNVDARTLITELEATLDPLYPAESQHGLSVEQLLREKVAFFVLRQDGVAAGCGGVQLFGTEYGEVKRMYIRPQYRGLGLAKSMLDHLESYARERDVKLLRLETGIYQTEAIGLYERMGFQTIPPFGAYQPDPLSRFYEKRIG
jgi:ribosomal protein S18 acetylase RimI-like enzyme